VTRRAVPAGIEAQAFNGTVPVGAAVAMERESHEYEDFLAGKRPSLAGSGLTVDPSDINPVLFPFQRDLTRWSLQKGRAALFPDAGLGKTPMQLEWARLSGQRTLILAPLSVARQTVQMAQDLLGMDVPYVRHQDEVRTHQITITNYEMMQHFDPEYFGAVVLDESSILKATEGVYRNKLIDAFERTAFRLCCTATPSPNDTQEITNHSAFLSIMPRRDVLATFFVHAADDARASGWRLKGHARPAFWRWLASWSMAMKKPSDLGYSDEGYELPALSIEPRIVGSNVTLPGKLFAAKLHGVSDRAQVRRQTKEARVKATLDLLTPDEPWILWCGLNDEGRDLARELGDRAILVEGADSPEAKAEALEAFIDSPNAVLVTKPTIAGFGMNFQHCAQMAFVGLSDSYEQYYQSIRRCWRYGQTRPVTAHVVLSEIEESIFANVLRKEREANQLAEELVKHVAAFEKAELGGVDIAGYEYEEGEQAGDKWRMLLGDSAERMADLPDESADLAVFSPPFQALYVYSPTERDLGNCATPDEFFAHMDYITAEMKRVMKPGRIVAVHCAQITAQKVLDGYIGLKDFRGQLIEHYTKHGFIYHREVCIDKDPQAQAIRTHSKALLFKQMRTDRSWLGPAIADFILVFRNGIGDPEVAIDQDPITEEQWIAWARPVWYGIRETETLQAPQKGNDERHIAPLQLGTIERCVRLWSNPGETVLSPFAGIGSEGYVAVKAGRHFVGVELKRSYFDAACRNLRQAEEGISRRML
jgi:DNA modification methylase